MNKSTIFLLLILTIVSCGKTTEIRIDKSEFQNKTFSVYSESEQDTLFIEFQDSTHQIYGSLWQGKIPWRISNYEKANFLVLDNRVIGIKKLTKNKFKCTYIGLKDNEFEMDVRNPKWVKEQVYGTWVKKESDKLYDHFINDSILQFKLPPLLSSYTQREWSWPMFYEIMKDTIKSPTHNSIKKSELEINNTNEFLLMKLGDRYEDELNWQWHIKSLSDSIMVVERIITKLSSTEHITDTLIKKR